MKLVWCPETASKSYIDAVRSLSALSTNNNNNNDTTIAEFISAMAGGWKAKVIVEAPARGESPATSIGLAAAMKHTQGRRVVVPTDIDLDDSEEGRAAAALVIRNNLEGVDFVVVDMRRRDASRVLREAKAGPRGMVVVCKNVLIRSYSTSAAAAGGGGGRRMMSSSSSLGSGMRVVRSAYLPIGRGLEVLHVGVGKGPRPGAAGRRWIKHVDTVTGEEHLFRKCH